jgi:catechol 2,3-dioxygenase-like lactoylglutathione lyase family enzyme
MDRDQPHHTILPAQPRWTRLALRVNNVEESIAWYERYTPLRLLKRGSDAFGTDAWLADPGAGRYPMVLGLSQFDPETDPFGYAPHTVLGPYAHIGIELTSRAAVDEIAAQAEAEGALSFSPTEMPPPIGYICFVEDPDGNTIQFSYDQGTYDAIHEKWHRDEQETEPE